MSAGLPGLGLGGLFFIFSALLSPFVELWRTLRGRSSGQRWRMVARQLAQALAMIVAIDLTIRAAYAGLGKPAPVAAGTVLPLVQIGFTTILLIAVIGAAKVAHLGLRARTAAVTVAARVWALSGLCFLVVGGVVTMEGLALLRPDAPARAGMRRPGVAPSRVQVRGAMQERGRQQDRPVSGHASGAGGYPDSQSAS